MLHRAPSAPGLRLLSVARRRFGILGKCRGHEETMAERLKTWTPGSLGSGPGSVDHCAKLMTHLSFSVRRARMMLVLVWGSLLETQVIG